MKDDAIYDDISSTSNEEEHASERVVKVNDFQIKNHQSPHILNLLVNHEENQSR